MYGGISMLIGIIGAMDCEVDRIKEVMEISEIQDIAMMKYYRGKLEGVPIVVVCCGIGKVNSAIAAQVIIDKYHVDYMLNIGIAGAISEKLDVGDVVISDEVIYHDFDSYFIKSYYPWLKNDCFEADADLIKVCENACRDALSIQKTYVGKIVSGDQFVSDSGVKDAISAKHSALCVEMEGASIAHTCYVNNVPFVLIRSISDKANEEATVSFDEFVKIAAEQCMQIIVRVMKELKAR
jgi:adenosylhomocysteine nucleosidase